MRNFLFCSLIAVAVACGGSVSDDMSGGVTGPPKAKKPDPFVTIRVRNQLDTTSAPGRGHWHIYTLLSGPNIALNGIGLAGTISLQDIRLHHDVLCGGAAADSVGQRLITMLALADTTTENLTPDATAQSLATEWYNGNHALPSGWMALTFTPIDAWDSAQYLAGHGLTRGDPIKWGFDWTASGTATFYERTDSEATCATF